jgi:hypothetical protein
MANNINKCMKFDLPFDSSYIPVSIHVVGVGNVQLPVSLKVIKTFVYIDKNCIQFYFCHLMVGICHRMLKNYYRKLIQLCQAVAYTENTMTLETIPGKLNELVYPSQTHQNSLKEIFLDG